MMIQRMDHVGVVVDDLEAAIAFFVRRRSALSRRTHRGTRWADVASCSPSTPLSPACEPTARRGRPATNQNDPLE